MTQDDQPKGPLIKEDSIHPQLPTHRHSSEFWESLGRVVGTFGYLEKILARAIYVFLATKPYDESEVDKKLVEWFEERVEKAIAGQLGFLISEYETAVKNHPEATVTEEEFDGLIDKLREYSDYRNALCHGSWESLPDENGASVPVFVFKKDMKVFETPINHHFLNKLRHNTALLICEVMNTVIHMGWQFPGSDSPGKPINGE